MQSQLEKMKPGEVPSLIRDWCSGQDESGRWSPLSQSLSLQHSKWHGTAI